MHIESLQDRLFPDVKIDKSDFKWYDSNKRHKMQKEFKHGESTLH